MKKCALITGAAKNTGPAVAELFARNGVEVFITSRRGEDAKQTAQELRNKTGKNIVGLEFDQGRTESIIPLFDEIEARGYVVTQLVMNAAAQGLNCDSLTVSQEDWESVIHTNVVGGFLCAREAAIRMRKQEVDGSILFIGSNTAYHAIRNRSSYITSKGAIASLVKSLALDWGQYGIRVNCLMPGPIHTDRWDCLDAETVAFRRNRAPLKKEATAQDIANAVWFLSSDQSANTTGSELLIDGGMHIQLHPSM